MADIEPINQQSISDDQELAKVLAGVSQQADDTTDTAAAAFTPPTLPPVASDDAAAPAPAAEPEAEAVAPVAAAPEPAIELPTPSMPSAGSDDLDGIKQQALSELRPLVDKLDVSPEEKFDTYLLLLRSTDDKDLIAPAHDAAKSIADETRRAQALLDIIKEIDFLSNPQPKTI